MSELAIHCLPKSFLTFKGCLAVQKLLSAASELVIKFNSNVPLS